MAVDRLVGSRGVTNSGFRHVEKPERCPGESLSEYWQRCAKWRRTQARADGKVVYESWREVPGGLKTAGQWEDEDRRPRKDARTNQHVLVNGLYQNPYAKLYALDQTEPFTPTPYRRALRTYSKLFVGPSDRDNYLWWDGAAWKHCRPRDPSDDRPDPTFRPLDRDKARRHVLGREIYGSHGKTYTRHLLLDPDLHTGRNEDGSKRYGDPKVFQEQMAVLVPYLHGRYACHFQVKDHDAEGLHLILVFGNRLRLDRAVAKLRALLVGLDRRHPDLAEAARRAS
jgi:hypothetical protein